MRDFFVGWIIGCVVCWIAFISVFFTSRKTVLKSWLDTSSIPCYLSSFSSILLKCNLDTSSTPGGLIELLFLNLILCCSIPSRYLSCQALLKGLYILPLRFFSHFFDLSQSVHDCSSPKHSHFHSKLVPRGFFKLFQVSLYLVSF